MQDGMNVLSNMTIVWTILLNPDQFKIFSLDDSYNSMSWPNRSVERMYVWMAIHRLIRTEYSKLDWKLSKETRHG